MGKNRRDLFQRKSFFETAYLYGDNSCSCCGYIFYFLFFIEYKQPGNSDSLDKYVALLEEPVLDSSQIQVYLSSQDKITVEEKTASVTYSSKGSVLINEEKQETDSLEKVEQEYKPDCGTEGKNLPT